MVTPVYAALFALLLVILSFRVLLMRRKLGVGVGNGDNIKLERAIGAHANFTEYVPIALLLLFFLESGGATVITLNVLCAILLLGRIIHAYGVSQVDENYRFRVLGMVMTLGVIISSSLRLLTG